MHTMNHYLKRRLIGYLQAIIVWGLIIGAYLLTAYLDERAMRQELNEWQPEPPTTQEK